MDYCFDSDFDRRAFSGKWRGAAEGVIPMTVADMDFPLMPEVVRAVKEAADRRDFGYLSMRAEDYAAVQDWIARRTGEVIPAGHLLNTPGVLYTTRCAMYALTEPGDKVVIQTPLHTPSIKSASMMGRVPLKNWLIYRDGRYTMDFDHLEACFREGAKVLMMCGPNNPTGRVWTQAEMDTVAELANRYDVFIVSDEIHRDILWDGNKHISPASMPSLKDRSVSAISTSKTFNMGGFHVGTAIIPNDEIRQKVREQLNNFGFSCGRPTVVDRDAQTAAYLHGEEWYRQMLAYIEGNFACALSYLEGLPVSAAKPEGTFLLWLDIREMKLDNAGLWDLMRNRWRVVGDPGSYYDTADYQTYTGMEHHIRLNLATQRKYVEEAFDRIRRYFR